MQWLRGILSRIVKSCWGLYGEKDRDKNTLHYVSNSTSDTQEVRFHKPITEQAVHLDIDIIQLYTYICLSNTLKCTNS